jgi:MYXO-CTERM domain-containing protein
VQLERSTQYRFQSCIAINTAHRALTFVKALQRLTLGVLAAGLALGTAAAQTSDPNAAGPGANTTNTNRTEDRRGFDYGWLGLLGLGGLLGLRKQNVPDRLHTGTTRT